jgi:hypothetical protein
LLINDNIGNVVSQIVLCEKYPGISLPRRMAGSLNPGGGVWVGHHLSIDLPGAYCQKFGLMSNSMLTDWEIGSADNGLTRRGAVRVVR